MFFLFLHRIFPILSAENMFLNINCSKKQEESIYRCDFCIIFTLANESTIKTYDFFSIINTII